MTLRTAVLTMVLALLAAAAFAQPGRLTANDPTLDSGEYYDVYEVEAQVGVPITIGISSRDFDPYLMVVDPTGGRDFQVDDSEGHGFDVFETFTPTLSGPHQLLVTSAFAGRSGAYELRIEIAEAPNEKKKPAKLGVPAADATAAAAEPQSVAPTGDVRTFEPRPAVAPPIPTVAPEPGTMKGIVGGAADAGRSVDGRQRGPPTAVPSRLRCGRHSRRR